MDVILKYFPSISTRQKEQLEALKPVYEEWNNKINVISRKDMDHFYLHHVLHSLAIVNFIRFQPDTTIIDIGTGGGFPGIPLSIFFPEANFTLLDSIGKKIKVVNAVIETIGLKNATGIQARAESFKGKFDFIISRAVTTLPEFVKFSRHLIAHKNHNAICNGILYLKGGDLESETRPFKKSVSITPLSKWFEEPFFESKKLLHLPLK